MPTSLSRIRIAFVGMVACLWAVPSLADDAVPAQQSACEILANKFNAQHPHADVFEYLKMGYFPLASGMTPHPPSAYRDPDSGMVFSVESDGRHLTAKNADSKVLWVRNPFVDEGMCPYRWAHPYISWIGPPGGDFGRQYLGRFKPTPDTDANASILKELSDEIRRGRKVERPKAGDRFIGLVFNSSQVGYVNIRNGKFYFFGQN